MRGDRLYLKSIEMYGFKSFAERAEIRFEEGVTGIVGPNGSGKSNITDAVRWVLGEQSAKILRGTKMEDLIFNGTDRRKQLGMAEVALTFDNSEGMLPIDYREVSVKRRVYRSGESEYLINNQSCKLRDIKELFMDTGIGIDGYSIIGQGRIDSILSSKSEDRRKIFEEAAGIVKYKTRKETTQRKLEKTNQNILRVEDILKELEIRIDPLRIEAEKAEAYEGLHNELKNLEISLFMEEIDRINEKLKDNREKAEAVRERVRSCETDRDRIKKALGAGGMRLEALRKKSEADERSVAELQEKRNQANYEMELTIERKRAAEKEKALIREQMEKAAKTAEELREVLEDREGQLRDMRFQERQGEEEKVRLEAELESARAALENARQALAVEKNRAMEELNRSAEFKNETIRLESKLQAIGERLEKVAAEDRRNEDMESERRNRRIELLGRMEETEAERAALASETDLLRKSLADLRGPADVLKSKAERLERTQETLKERQIFHRRLVEHYEGFNNSVRNTLKALEKSSLAPHVEGPVAGILDVDKKYETAIETALGGSSQYIICDTLKSASAIIEFAKRKKTGRITLLPLDDVKGRNRSVSPRREIPGFIGCAKDLVRNEKRYDPIVEFLLGGILIVEDARTAVSMIKSGSKAFRLITLEGDVFNPGGTVTGGSSKGRQSGLLSRKRLLDETEKALEANRREHEAVAREMEALLTVLTEKERDLKTKDSMLAEADKAWEVLSRKLEILDSALEAVLERRAEAADERSELLQERSRLQEAMKTADERNRAIESVSEGSERRLSELSSLEARWTVKVDEAGGRLSKRVLETAVLNEKAAALESEILRLQTSIGRETAHEADLSKQIEVIGERIQSCEDQREEKKRIQASLGAEIKSRQEDNERGRMAAEALSAELGQLRRELDQNEETQTFERERLHKLELSDARLQMNYDAYIKQLWEAYQLSYVEARDVRGAIESRSAVVRRVEALKNEIAALGDVNKASIKEYKEVLHRHEFLGKQKTDLQEAKTTLEDLIVRLEEKMARIFKEEVRSINRNFNETFRNLFSGGRAEIIFEDPQDMLNSHIDILAEPPGKKLQNLNLLSGGEKALTAIALLFAILMRKPSPFCVLDEIEAALDDVNVYRFASFLKDFQDQSQFILITHRKGTMEIADVLYGITMEEKGISKVVSLEMKNKAS